jgi:hypothetical protein
MTRPRLKPETDLADAVVDVLAEVGIDSDKCRKNKHVVDLVLDWRSLRLDRKTLIAKLKKIRDSYPNLKKISRLRLKA